jgi:uncharacterized protein YqhQ
MDLKKIFMKDACPTKTGGQAVMEGIMMKSASRAAVVVRLPDGSLYMKNEALPPASPWAKYPIIRGVVIFVASMVQGVKTLMYSADVLEKYDGEGGVESDKFTLWLEAKFGKKGAWNVMIYLSVIFAIALTVGVFIIGPTAAISWLKIFTHNEIVLNLAEGVLRIVLFVLYVVLISRMEEIHRVFKYHGAEHKCIHCLENGEELTPENCQKYYTLHPRCGTSFLMFVMVISLVLFSLLGWPNLVWRILSRLLLIPFIAGLSYELLRWAGSSDGWLVKLLSLPGLYLQKLTTAEPNDKQLEVAIAAIKAVTDETLPLGEGPCDLNGRLIVKELEPEPAEIQKLEPEQEKIEASIKLEKEEKEA